MSASRPIRGGNDLVQSINALCEWRLGRGPNWDNPTGYNDKIQWLKVHDQTELHKAACDKLKARDIAQHRAGDVLIPLLYSGNEIPRIKQPHILKMNHDSGTAQVVCNEHQYLLAKKKIQGRINKKYGLSKGEWGYWFVTPRVMAEDLMPLPVIDYKFHCVHGDIRWVQVIRERDTGPKETILDAEGKLLPLHLGPKMQHVPDARVYPGDAEWASLTCVARKLAHDWRYVRVDLYYVRSGPFYGVRFGELTPWPMSGCCTTKDEPIFGEMLDIDLSYRLPAIVA